MARATGRHCRSNSAIRSHIQLALIEASRARTPRSGRAALSIPSTPSRLAYSRIGRSALSVLASGREVSSTASAGRTPGGPRAVTCQVVRGRCYRQRRRQGGMVSDGRRVASTRRR
jgi:hypothetical protein